jgi:probable F420-dependent oxidoreductase
MTAPDHPFRFGAHTGVAKSLAAWQETARMAEDSGYSLLTIWDHLDPQFSYGPALLAAAFVTTTLRVGTLVLDNNYRHPALVAMEAATLATLTGGRFELGLGAGWRPENYARSGIPFESPAVRAGRLIESVQIIKRLLGQEPVTFAGQHYTLAELPGYLPEGIAPPPLLIGAGGRRILTFAAREADTIGIVPRSLPGGGLDIAEIAAGPLEEKIALVRQAAAGRATPPELNMLLQVVAVTPDRQQAAEDLAARWGLTVEAVLASPAMLIGTVDEIVETLLERRERLGLSYLTVFDRDMHAFAPVVARLAGR